MQSLKRQKFSADRQFSSPNEMSYDGAFTRKIGLHPAQHCPHQREPCFSLPVYRKDFRLQLLCVTGATLDSCFRTTGTVPASSRATVQVAHTSSPVPTTCTSTAELASATTRSARSVAEISLTGVRNKGAVRFERSADPDHHGSVQIKCNFAEQKRIAACRKQRSGSANRTAPKGSFVYSTPSWFGCSSMSSIPWTTCPVCYVLYGNMVN